MLSGHLQYFFWKFQMQYIFLKAQEKSASDRT